MSIAKVGLIAAAGLFFISGCSAPIQGMRQSNQARANSAELPIFFAALIDASDSGSEDDKLAYGSAVLDEVESLHHQRDAIRIFIFDHDPREVFSEVPADTDAFALSLRSAIMKPIPCHACGGVEPARSSCKVCGGTGRERITRTALAIENLARSMAEVPVAAYRVRILIATDGGYEDHSPPMEKVFVNSVAALARIPNLEVVLYGVRAGEREALRAKFKAVENRGCLKILGPGEEVSW